MSDQRKQSRAKREHMKICLWSHDDDDDDDVGARRDAPRAQKKNKTKGGSKGKQRARQAANKSWGWGASSIVKIGGRQAATRHVKAWKAAVPSYCLLLLH